MKRTESSSTLPPSLRLKHLWPVADQVEAAQVEAATIKLEAQPWRALARKNQITPKGDWRVWLIMAGRGWGKTRTGAEDAKAYGLSHPGSRVAVVAPTYPDARDTCIEGESGLLGILPHELVENWNRSMGELRLTNGTRYKLFSADKPDRLRGPQHHRAWCDEPGSWRYPDAFDMLMFGLRLGSDPRAVVTGTPKPVKLIRELLGAKTTVVTRGSTYENRDNLAPAFLEQIVNRYEGTRLGRQELLGELLDDVPGALWTRQRIDELRVKEAPDLTRIVVSIDPAMTANEDSDETGIGVAGKGVDGHLYVLKDLSCRMSPDGWARRAVNAYHEFKADRVLAEVNNGGDLVESTLRTVDSKVSYKAVHASRGKRVRAEPIAALYEQGKAHHIGSMPELEDQMCSFTSDGYDGSPDRVDWLVWAASELMLSGKEKVIVSPGGSQRESLWSVTE